MIIWVLYLSIGGEFTIKHKYSFAFKPTCATIGETLVKEYRYKAYRCVKDIKELK